MKKKTQKKQTSNQRQFVMKKKTQKKQTSNQRQFVMVLGGILMIGISWYFYEQMKQNDFDLNQSSQSGVSYDGKQLFAENCATCHGKDGIGENPNQPRGGMTAGGVMIAPALNGTGHTWHHPDQMLFHTIKNGSMAQNSKMVGFKDKLNDDQIRSVLRYIKSLWPEIYRIRQSQL